MPKNDGRLDGFVFRDGETYDAAARDQQIIAYLQKQVDLTNAEAARRVYEQAISQDLFSTVVGFTFLKELQEALLQEGTVSRAELSPIPVKTPEKKETPAPEAAVPAGAKERKTVRAEERAYRQADSRYRKRYRASFVLNIILAAAIAAMFFILLSSNLPTIVNYRTKIINEYSSWKAELDDREKALDAREQELNDRESTLQGLYGDETEQSQEGAEAEDALLPASDGTTAPAGQADTAADGQAPQQ